MRISIETKDLQDQLNTLNALQTRLRNTNFTNLKTPDMVQIVSELGETSGQIKAFTSLLKQAAVNQAKG